MYRVECWATIGDDPGHLAGMPDLVIEAVAAVSKAAAEAEAEARFSHSMRSSRIRRVVHVEATEIEGESAT